jgi:hypothetical protein
MHIGNGNARERGGGDEAAAVLKEFTARGWLI